MQFVIIIIDFIRRKTEIVTSLRIAYFDLTKQELNIHCTCICITTEQVNNN